MQSAAESVRIASARVRGLLVVVVNPCTLKRACAWSVVMSLRSDWYSMQSVIIHGMIFCPIHGQSGRTCAQSFERCGRWDRIWKCMDGFEWRCNNIVRYGWIWSRYGSRYGKIFVDVGGRPMVTDSGGCVDTVQYWRIWVDLAGMGPGKIGHPAPSFTTYNE